MKSKQIFLTLTLVGLLSLSLTGCGGDKAPGSADPSTPESQVEDIQQSGVTPDDAISDAEDAGGTAPIEDENGIRSESDNTSAPPMQGQSGGAALRPEINGSTGGSDITISPAPGGTGGTVQGGQIQGGQIQGSVSIAPKVG